MPEEHNHMWNVFLDVLSEALLDSLKALPFLLLCFALLEFLEHRAGNRAFSRLESAKRAGPVLGAAFGALPQCGFSVVASNLYIGGAISLGTLIAVFLSTSDEALIVMFSAPEFIPDILLVMGIKIVSAVVLGYIIDLILRRRHFAHSSETEAVHAKHDPHCHEGCGCSCDSSGSFIKAVLRHSLSIWLFIFVINLVLGLVIELAGTAVLERILLSNTAWQPLISALVGLIPNCTASVLLAELYMQGVLSMPSLIAGLCTATGLGLLTLFRVNRNVLKSIFIVVLVYLMGAMIGYAAMLFV